MLSLVVAVAVASTWSCEDEDTRITRHLEDALIQLRSVTPPALSEGQRTQRAKVLGDLERYIHEQKFPRASGDYGPVFIDEDDRHCAMGALLAWNGGAEIANHIRATRNLATVPTLADEPGLADWLNEHGMTAEEAALVQPGYFTCVPTIDICWYRQFNQIWYANGAFNPDGGEPVWARLATSDGQCAGPERFSPRWEAPLGTVFLGDLALSGDRFVHGSWVNCRNPLQITRNALEQPTVEDCMRQMIADDPRALLPSCGYVHSTESQVRRCADDGRYFAATIPANGVEASVRAYYDRYVTWDLDDAGIPLTAAAAVEAEAWSHSDDGGTVPAGDFPQLLTWNGTNPDTCVFLADGGLENRTDGGAPMPMPIRFVAVPRDTSPAATLPHPEGCSSSAGLAVGLAAFLLARRRIR